MRSLLAFAVVVFVLPVPNQAQADGAQWEGVAVDADTGNALPVRLYIQSAEGKWFFASSLSPDGSAVEYRKQRFEKCVEMHTTLSAHPFAASLPPGQYTVTAERGKEYLPVTHQIEIKDTAVKTRFEMRRWINLAERNWYSGDTHVHRTLAELPNVMLAEDLNVALPLTYWVTQSHTSPQAGDKNSQDAVKPVPAYLDPTHVIYPINTEYEIFTVGAKRHTLGAVFILGHREVFREGTPPVGPIAARARREGALLDLDKHSWPWSLMLVPVMKVDLFELSNNHVWRTEFGFNKWTAEMVPEYMNIQRGQDGYTEWGWIDFGFQTYYTLLNCGFPLRPSAGTASGVHPVPLGFGRVYVQVEGDFSYQKWMQGLAAGRSFVTTGPMLFVTANESPPGATLVGDGRHEVQLKGSVESALPIKPIEIVINGQVVKRITPDNTATESGGYRSEIESTIAVEESSWVAIRAFEDRPDGRVRFAHSSPVHVKIKNHPLRPRRVEVEYLIRRMEEELERNRDVLQEAGLAEYRQALQAFKALRQSAR